MTQGDDAGGGLRARKKRETRVALSQAAIRLCVQHGWDNVTVDDIAAAANVSVRTFRNYFSSKAEAIAASHLERMLRIADELRARPVTEPLWDSISCAVQAQFVPQGETGAGSPETSAGRTGSGSCWPNRLCRGGRQGERSRTGGAGQGDRRAHRHRRGP